MSVSDKHPSPRSTARLGAVQALYQSEISDEVKLDDLIKEYQSHRLGQEIEGDQYGAADEELFADILKGATERRDEIDAEMGKCLRDGWPVERLERVLRATLRAAGYELLARPDVPTNVIINEYVEVTKAFYDKAQISFVNGVLDKMSKTIRS